MRISREIGQGKAGSGGQDRRGGDYLGPAGPGVLQRFQTTSWKRNSVRMGPVHPSSGDRRRSGIGAIDHGCRVGSGADAARLHPGGNAVPGRKRFHPTVYNPAASDRERVAAGFA